MSIVALGRYLIAIAAASVGIMALAYGDYAPAWHSFPEGIPGREIWIAACALILIAASAGLCVPRIAIPCLWGVGAYYLIWVVIASGPIFAAPLSIGAWYGTTEALTAVSGAVLLYSIMRPKIPPLAARVARILFGLTCVFYGGSHFLYAGYTASMVPSWLPGGLVLAYVTGACHIAAGLALVAGVLAPLAATLEAAMMSLFGLLVWAPTFFIDDKPKWATPAQNQWSELVVNLVLAAAAWIVALSLRPREPAAE
jgi:uncharacterized membrane protein YphA (DoxX/SURF4 family)